MSEINETELKAFFYKQIFMGAIISCLLYLLTVWLIFGMMPALILTTIIFCGSMPKVPLFWGVVKKIRQEEAMDALITHLVLDALIILLPTFFGLYLYFDAPLLHVALYTLVLTVIIAKTFHANIGTFVYMAKTGKLYEPDLSNDPVRFVGLQLSTFNFLLIPLYAGLCWWLIEDISLSVLIALLMFCTQYVAIHQRAKLIYEGNKKVHDLLHHLFCTIAMALAVVLMKMKDPQVVYDHLYPLIGLAAIYYLMSLNDMKFFNDNKESKQ